MTEFKTILFSVDEGIATITLNRPENMNAFNPQMTNDLLAAFDLTDQDDEVKAVIVTGVGDRAFCAGADLGAGGDTFDYEAYDDAEELPQANGIYRDLGGLVTMRIFDSLKPVIAASNGAAAGVGASMQLAMDIRIASTTARYGFVFARRGIAPDAAASWFLPRIVGISTALSWTYSGKVFGAEEALDKGLVQSLHEPEDLLPAAREIAREIADNCAPVSIAVTRRLMWEMLAAEHPMEAHKADSRAIQSRGASDDVREGVAAFLEKRDPVYPDKVSRDFPELFPDRSKPVFG